MNRDSWEVRNFSDGCATKKQRKERSITCVSKDEEVEKIEIFFKEVLRRQW
jgi:hypothetical protein